MIDFMESNWNDLNKTVASYGRNGKIYAHDHRIWISNGNVNNKLLLLLTITLIDVERKQKREQKHVTVLK